MNERTYKFIVVKLLISRLHYHLNSYKFFNDHLYDPITTQTHKFLNDSFIRLHHNPNSCKFLNDSLDSHHDPNSHKKSYSSRLFL